jgi:phosphoribosylformimino-5-aminoimidazole carboxamide ribotide isomerase
MKFRPCIDLVEGRVRQIVGRTYDEHDGRRTVTNFDTATPASSFAQMYCRDGLRGGHVILIGPGNETAACEALAAYPNGLQVGGGITPRNAERFLAAGASHVIVTSYVFPDGDFAPERLAEMVSCVGRERLVLDVSCTRKGDEYCVVTQQWQHVSGVRLDSRFLSPLGESCAELLVHAVDVEGSRGGVDSGLIGMLASDSPVPCTYAGGVRSVEDLDAVREAGDGRVDVTVGSALDIFGGSLRYDDVVAWHRRQG